jgi:hypothetical protein
MARRLLFRDRVYGVVLLFVVTAIGLAVAQGAPAAAPGGCVVLEDFSGSKVGDFPAGWEARKDEGRRVYTVAEDEGRRFLRAVAKGLGLQAARETPGWNLDTHPVLTWAWRPRQLPSGADERESATNDSALAVYMAVPHSKVRGPKALKYIWSEKVPVGTRLTSNVGLTQVRVLRSGPPPTNGGWIEERVNVRDDWKAAFRESATPKAAGIVVLTDADDTRSTAAGDYAAFRACPE